VKILKNNNLGTSIRKLNFRISRFLFLDFLFLRQIGQSKACRPDSGLLHYLMAENNLRIRDFGILASQARRKLRD